MKIAVSYALFALIATVVNIASQDIFLRLYSGDLDIGISILVGTATGLVVKYLLDKKYIFRFQTRNALHDTQIFTLYTVMGLLTTLVFWGFEFGFELLYQTKAMRYLGGVIGLAIGYLIKYQLDKRYVFVNAGA